MKCGGFCYYLCEFFCVGMMIKQLFKNPFILITSVAFLLQTVMLVLFYALPDPLGLSMSEMFAGKTIWQIFMAYGAILVMSSIFTFLKSPRALAVFYVFYFFFAIADYEVFRFNHQRLSYSFIRTYFHISNITDATTVSTLGGDGFGTVLWVGLIFLILASGIAFCVTYSMRQKRMTMAQIAIAQKPNKRIAVTMLSSGLTLSLIPLLLFIIGSRGVTNFPFQIDWRFTLGKYTLTAPVLHIAGLETFEFFRDGYSITDELIQDLDAFLPADFASARSDKNYPGYRDASQHEFKATKPYNIVFIFGESYKGRVLNQMLEGDTVLAPNLWKMANVGGFWFKNAFSGSYPTVRGTTSTYLGFPSHPNRDVPAFYASNHFKGFQEYLTNYHRAYMTVSNPVFDHTLPFVERFMAIIGVLPRNRKFWELRTAWAWIWRLKCSRRCRRIALGSWRRIRLRPISRSMVIRIVMLLNPKMRWCVSKMRSAIRTNRWADSLKRFTNAPILTAR